MPENDQPSAVQMVDLSTKTNEALKKYQAIASELAQIDQDKLHRESVQKLAEELSSRPISDFQRSQSIDHIKQHLNNPDFELSPQEQQKLEKLKSAVDTALKTSTDTNQLTYEIHKQIEKNPDFDVPDLNQFQRELKTKLDTLEELPKYQQTRQHLKKELSQADPKQTIKTILENQEEIDAENVSTQITSQAFDNLITSSSPLTKQQLQTIIDNYQPSLSPTIKQDILSVLTVDQEIIQSSKIFDSTKQQLVTDGINQQNLPEFYALTQLSSQDLRTVIVASDQPSSSNQNVSLPNINNYLQAYHRLTSGQTTISFWKSPTQAIRSWFSNAGSSGQIGTKNFFQRVFSSFGSGGRGSGGSSVGNFAKKGLSQVGQALGSAAKTGTKAAAKVAVQAAKAAASAAGKAASQFAAKALLLNPYFWLGVVVVIIIAAVLYLAGGASPQKVALMQTDSISGQGGSGGSGIGFCDPTTNPEECTPLFCEGNCMCPVSGTITQGPGGSYSHQTANAIDIGLTNGDSIYSISDGIVSYAGFSTAGYGNLVIVDNPDGTKLYYAHLESYFVTIGQAVVVHEQIGTGDNTGNSSGPHLHLGYVGPGAQNILNLFNFTEEQIAILNGCSNGSEKSCGGISCQN